MIERFCAFHSRHHIAPLVLFEVILLAKNPQIQHDFNGLKNCELFNFKKYTRVCY